MKRIITIFTLMALTITGLFLTNHMLLLAKSSTTASDSMVAANQLYESGQYPLAAQAYQQLVDQGYEDSGLYYNLGNAYYKQGDFGRAILNYRQAEQLAPRDADIKANLELARGQVADEVGDAVENAGFIDNIAKFSTEYFTLNEVAIAAVVAWIVFVSLVIAYTSTRKGSLIREGLQYALVVATLALTLGIFGLGSRLYTATASSEGVVVASEVDVTSGPGSQYATEFSLHDGTEVDLLESRGNWVRLAVPNSDMQGWVPTSAVEAVSS